MPLVSFYGGTALNEIPCEEIVDVVETARDLRNWICSRDWWWEDDIRNGMVS